MVLTNVLITLLLTICYCSAGHYENNILLRITVRSNEEFEKVKQVEGLHVWNDAAPVNGSILAHVDSDHKNSSLKALDDLNIKYEIISYNLQAIIDKETADLKKRIRLPGGALYFEIYNTLSDIYDYIDSLEQKYPQKAKRLSIGRTSRGREIKGFIIRQNIEQTKPIVFFECGIHAREWISPATCLWIANELLTKSNPLLDKYEFHIIPVTNPDGYQYTWLGFRLWRKNLSYNSNFCLGTDLNRNFDVAFCQTGSSPNSCDETYCGKSAFSELESKAIRDYFLKIKDSVAVYFSFHSFSQLWMYSYGYTTNDPQNSQTLNSLSKIGVNALSSVYGTQYKLGSIAQILYPASGTTIDWVYQNLPSKLCFTLELRDTGTFGFLLPFWEIKPTANETLAGVTAVLNAV